MSLTAMKWVFENSQTKGSARVLMLVLADMANTDGFCWPGKSSLAKLVNVDIRYIPTLVQECEKLGELRVIQHKKDNKENGTNHYILLGVADAHQKARVGRALAAKANRKSAFVKPQKGSEHVNTPLVNTSTLPSEHVSTTLVNTCSSGGSEHVFTESLISLTPIDPLENPKDITAIAGGSQIVDKSVDIETPSDQVSMTTENPSSTPIEESADTPAVGTDNKESQSSGKVTATPPNAAPPPSTPIDVRHTPIPEHRVLKKLDMAEVVRKYMKIEPKTDGKKGRENQYVGMFYGAKNDTEWGKCAFEEPATLIEVIGFFRWYREEYEGMSLEKAATVKGKFEIFRQHPKYKKHVIGGITILCTYEELGGWDGLPSYVVENRKREAADPKQMISPEQQLEAKRLLDQTRAAMRDPKRLAQ